MSNDLEFAIKQDIRNNPVVREVDLDQKREFIRMLGWSALAIGTLMFALLPRANASNLGYKIDTLKNQLAAEQEWQRVYGLELETLLRPQEIRRRAVAELHMIDPPGDLILPLELVPVTAPASRAIVASAAR
jgi:hypothetical protein